MLILITCWTGMAAGREEARQHRQAMQFGMILQHDGILGHDGHFGHEQDGQLQLLRLQLLRLQQHVGVA